MPILNISTQQALNYHKIGRENPITNFYDLHLKYKTIAKWLLSCTTENQFNNCLKHAFVFIGSVRMTEYWSVGLEMQRLVFDTGINVLRIKALNKLNKLNINL